MTKARYAALGLVGAALLFLGGISALNAISDGPVRFRIAEGEQWAGPPLRRFRFWWGLHAPGDETKMTMRFERLSQVPVGTGFKLWGLSGLSGRALWPGTARRVERYGWDEYADIAHENSWRFTGRVVRRDGRKAVAIRTYTYERGLGGISARKKRVEAGIHPERLGYVFSGEPAAMTLCFTDRTVTYMLATPRGQTAHRVRRTSSAELFAKHFAHADSGPEQPDAPARIAFTARTP
jgi:hypothetical protein